MKNDKIWTWIGALALSVVLAACGSGSGSGSVSLRLANATLTHPSLDLLINSGLSITATATDTVSAYVGPGAGSNTLQVNDSGSGTALATTVPTLTADQHYTLIAYESGGAVKTVVLNEDYTAPLSGTAQLRVYDVAPDAGKLDVYITDPSVTDLSTVASPTYSFTTNITTPLLTYSPGNYRVRITGYGNKADLRMDIPSITLANQEVATVLLTPTVGGTLLNGSTLVQQGTYSATRTTNARVRLASAVSGSATVAASAGATVIDSGSVAPAFGYYVLVPAASALNVSVNGNSVGAPAKPLPAGGDATLLVYGTPTLSTASLVLDDNRLPTDATTVKLNTINGITGTLGTVTLTANTAPVGIGIAPGAASNYVSIPGSANATNLTLTSSLHGIIKTDATNILIANTVYTVLSAGDYTAPQFLIR